MKKSLKTRLAAMGNKVALGTGLVMSGVGSAMAALDAGTSAAISTAQTDGVTLGGLVLAAVVSIFAFKLLRRAA